MKAPKGRAGVLGKLLGGDANPGERRFVLLDDLPEGLNDG